LKTKGSEVWVALTTALGNFWENTSDERSGLSLWLDEISVKFAEALPQRITDFADAILVLVGALDSILGILSGTEFSDGAWANLFEPIDMETDPLSMWFDNLFGGGEGTGVTDTFDFTQAEDMISGAWTSFGDIMKDYPSQQQIDAGRNTIGSKIAEMFTPGEDALEIPFAASLGDALVDMFTLDEETKTAQANSLAAISGYWDDFKGVFLFTDDAAEGEKSYPIREYFDTQLTEWEESMGLFIENIGISVSSISWEDVATVWSGIGDSYTTWQDEFLTSIPGDTIKNKLQEYFSPGSDELNTELTGLGGGFNTLDGKMGFTNTVIESVGGWLTTLGTKAIELKDNAIATLTTKTETLRKKMEDWRVKMTGVNLWIQNLINKVTLFITGALTDLSNFLTDTVNVVLEDARQLFQEISEWIAEKTEPAVLAINEAFDAMSDALGPLNDLLDTAAGLLEKVWDWAMQLPDWIVNWIKGGMPSAPVGGGGDSGDGGEATTTGGTAGQTSSIPSHGIPLLLPIGFGSDAPMTRGVGVTPSGIGSVVASVASTIGTATSKARTRTSVVPSVVIGAGSTVATQGGMVMTFGDVIISNDMDMAVFEARVRNVVSNSMIN
jgi:hypothetical protein